MNKFKNIFIFFLAFLITLSSTSLFFDQSASAKYVKGYYRKDGTYVHGYNRGGSSSTYTPSSDYPTFENKADSLTTYSSTTSYNNNSGTVNLYKGNQLVGNTSGNELVYVQGYYRKDGTYVRPHYRTHPNNFLNDNFSYLGLSTLKPIQKYPFYNFSSIPSVSTIEHYLQYQLKDKQLTTTNLTDLKNYAISLSNINLSNQNDNSIRVVGENFYKSLGINPTLSEDMAQFDVTGVITPSIYLEQILQERSLTVLPQDYDILKKAYLALLVASKDDEAIKVKAYTFGTKFYKQLFPLYPEQEIKDQIEMDLLQNFEGADNNELNNIADTIKRSVLYYNNSTPETYLLTSIKYYGNTMENPVFTDSYYLYLADLKLNYTQKLIEDGKLFYQQYHLNETQINDQIIADFILFTK
ncbi:hypothetical protein [Paenibacillus polymyxa]|uniref:hypothetical protein n=1 Tax=Paenibacillus polymyxa TaxID=1406 RepID=UPI0023F648F5|nr:hypothetical protein [Paenibacillus polymyxa]